MQGWSKRKPNRNKSYTKHYGSITYNNKPLHALPLRPPRATNLTFLNQTQKTHPLPSSHQKNWGKEKSFQRKCVIRWSRRLHRQAKICPAAVIWTAKNKDLPTFSASQESMFSARRKTSKTKRNYMIHSYLIGKNPVCSGWASKVLNSSKKYGFSHAQRRYLPSFRCFCACNPLSWADIVANLSSIHDKNHQIPSISLPSPLGGTSVRDDLSVLEISVQYYHLRVLGW